MVPPNRNSTAYQPEFKPSFLILIDMEPIKDIELSDSIDELARQLYQSGGFTAKKFSLGIRILERILQDNCTKFLSFPACIVSTGTRGVIREMVKRGLTDGIITTCGTLDHDLARVWKDYYHGSFMLDDRELHRKGLNRLGNILIPNESYGLILEEKIQPMIEDIYSDEKEIAPYELIWRIGKALEKEKNRESSILYWAWRNRIPVFVPGIFDGSFGHQLWIFWQNHRDFRLNLFKDEQMFADMVFEANKTGAMIIGGGISKHHTIWWNQFQGGLEYAVYITTAQEFDGSLSGARPREAISWGKLKEDARYVTIEGDATLILPLMISALLERLKK